MPRIDPQACKPPASAGVKEQAAWWFARLHSGHASDAERRAFEAWRDADPEHDRQYRNTAYFWDAALDVPRERLRAVVDARVAPRPARRRYLAWATGAACAVALLAAVLGPQWRAPEPGYATALATRPGELRELMLPDGSVLNLNTATDATVRLYEDRREVALLGGEITFSVRHSDALPFVIDAGSSRITVTGTRFNVRRDPGQLDVAVEHGSVQIDTGPWWKRKRRILGAGENVRIDEHGGMASLPPAQVKALTAWRRGKIVFDNAPMKQLVAEMARYLDYPLILGDRRLDNLSINAVFSIDDLDSMLFALPAIAPVKIIRRDDGAMVIVSR